MKYFIPVASDFISDKEIELIIQQNAKYLREIKCEQIEIDQFQNHEQVCYMIITGGTEQQVLEFQKKRKAKFENEEVVLLAHASHNSLPACLEVLAKLQQDKTKGKIIYLPQVSEILDDDHKPAIKELDDLQALKGFRIGLMGAPSDWLVASSPSSEIVQKTWGAEIIPIALREVEKLLNTFSQNEIELVKHSFMSKAASVLEPTDDEIDDNIRVYLALKKLVAKYDLNALTIRCFDLVLDLKTTGCFALSRLNDEGIIAGCEGDMVSTIGMLLVYKKTGRIPWMANPSRLDIENNSILIAHCTVPISIIDNYIIRSHFESGIGVGIQGTFPTGDVTIFRIGGNDLDKIWLANGKIISTSKEEDLCRTQIEVKLNSEYNVSELLTNPLGNHLIIVPGIFEELPII